MNTQEYNDALVDAYRDIQKLKAMRLSDGVTPVPQPPSLKRLKRDARREARRLGHRPTPFMTQGHGVAAAASCRDCEGNLYVSRRNKAGEVEVSGVAVRNHCKK